jgi:hypothetical protein
LKSGINVIQNLRSYYEKADLTGKQKLIGSIFPENLIIENDKCRTTQENQIILTLKGFERDFKKEKPESIQLFPLRSPYGNRTRVTRMKIWCPNP